MKSDLLLPQSLIKENSVSIRQALLLIAIVILWVYLPFLRYGGELSAHEGFYAVCADEYSPGLLVRAPCAFKYGFQDYPRLEWCGEPDR